VRCSIVNAPEGWAEVGGALEREYRFADFAEALAFVNRVGELAEREGHHPDVEIHWNRVKLRWWTHVRDAITERDHELAARSNELA
jgi:4a-hydroxytetrahydrobiopterin dehydratase